MSATTQAADRKRLSVAIITHNEEANIERTLRSVAFADEVIVVDSGSTDRTVELARALGATVIERAWSGFAQQKNFAIATCSGEWILSLDADEELTPELQTEIAALVLAPAATEAYAIRRRNLFLGRWIRHAGFYPDAKLRLFPASMQLKFGERAVHEAIAFAGPTLTLKYDLLHHAYPTLASYIEHMNRYSSLGAEILVQRGRISRSYPAFVWNVLFVPLAQLGWNMTMRGGLLDGREGLLLNFYQAVYTSWKYAKAWETGKKQAHLPRPRE